MEKEGKVEVDDNRAFIIIISHTSIWWNNLSCGKVKMHVLVGVSENRHTVESGRNNI